MFVEVFFYGIVCGWCSIDSVLRIMRLNIVMLFCRCLLNEKIVWLSCVMGLMCIMCLGVLCLLLSCLMCLKIVCCVVFSVMLVGSLWFYMCYSVWLLMWLSCLMLDRFYLFMCLVVMFVMWCVMVL